MNTDHPTAPPRTPRPFVTPDAVASLLLNAAERLSGRLDLGALVAELGRVALRLSDIALVGIGIHDAERELYTQHTVILEPSGPTPPHRHDTPLLESEAPLLQQSGSRGLSLCITREAASSDFQRTAADRGVSRYAALPLRLDTHFIGSLYCGLRSPADLSPVEEQFLQRLACLLAPAIWNCFTQQRFDRGDRRRDALIALTRGINTSLELANVLRHAREVVAQLDGHSVSGIAILDRAGEHFHSYRCYTAPGRRPTIDAPPEQIRVADSALAWIRDHQQTYISDDLAVRQRYANEAAVHAHGVRRYVGAPMIVRGDLRGAFFFGSREPHRPLRMDIWLYENIATQLGFAIDNALQHERIRELSERLNQQAAYLQEELRTTRDFDELIGDSAGIRQVRAAITRVATTPASVLITGETGVGKELVARAIHATSPRAAQPLVKLNCAAIPETMVESELFGHERGAFTSAVERRVGRFELAHDSTLFLDEVGELSLPVQAKLLRVLQDGEFERVGGAETLSTNVRIIAATNRDLAAAVAANDFRRDLFYRLNVFPIEVPPLRTRRDDIVPLAEFFVAHFNRSLGKRVTRIADDALPRLRAYAWPGNVRELRSVIERAMILSDRDVLAIDLPPAHHDGPAQPPQSLPTSPTTAFSTLDDAAADHIRAALRAAHGVIEGPTGAAALLGVKPSTLRYRMKRLGVHRASD